MWVNARVLAKLWRFCFYRDSGPTLILDRLQQVEHGDTAVFAVRVRFFQRQGYDATAAVSCGAIATTASWTAKSLLFLIALPFAAGNFHAPSSSGDRQTAIWIVLAVVLAAGIAIAVVVLVPRVRRREYV